MHTSRWLVPLLTIVSVADAQDLYVQQKASVEVFSSSITKGAANSLAGRIAVSTDKTVKILDAQTLAERAVLPAFTSSLSSLAFSPNGESLITGSADGSVGIWNSSNGSFVKSITSGGGILAAGVMGQSFILTAGLDRSLKLIDAISGKTLSSLTRLQEEIVGFSLHPEGKNVSVIFAGGQIRIFALPDLTLLQSLAEPGLRPTAVAYSKDGKLLAVGGIDGSIRLFSSDNWVLKSKLLGSFGTPTYVSFDAEGKLVAATFADSTLRVFDVKTTALRKTIRPTRGSFSFALFINAEYLCAATSTGQVIRWQVLAAPPDTLPPVLTLMEPLAPKGAERAKVYGKQIELRAIVSDANSVIEVTLNGSPVVLHNVEPKDSLVSPAGVRAMKFQALVPLTTVGVNTIEVRAKDEFGNIAVKSIEIDRLSQDEAIEVSTPLNNSETDKISAPLEFKLWFEASSFEVLVNLLPMVDRQNLTRLVPGTSITDDIPLVAGYNQIQIVVTAKTRERLTKTLGVTRKVLGPVSSGTTKSAPVERGIGPQRWAVVVGISEYANTGIPRLNFADNDAEAIAVFLEKPEGGGFERDHIRLLLNKDATLTNVRDALINFLSQAIDRDLVVIYFAGHGAPDPARPSNLYLLTHDSDPSVLGTSAFPMWQIQDVLGRYILAKRIVVFSDACHSGGISVDFATRGMGVTETNPINQYLADLARSKEGVVVFTASAAGEVSQELPEFRHGVFTYYLLKGMQGEADLNNDYTVSINELMQYVEEQVKRKTKGTQNPTRSQTAYDKDLPISVVSH